MLTRSLHLAEHPESCPRSGESVLLLSPSHLLGWLAPAGLAVMEVIREEGLQENALLVGSYLRRRLRELQVRN